MPRYIDVVYDLCASTFNNEVIYAQSAYLSIAQAIEAFHRFLRSAEYVSPFEYDKIRNIMLQSLAEPEEKKSSEDS